MRLDHPVLVVLLILPGDLREALEDPVLGVADAGDPRAVGEAQLRHLAAEIGTYRAGLYRYS